eukprot:g37356.t1
MCPVQQHKYSMPRDGQEQGDLESRFESPHGTQQLRAMVAHVEKLTHKGVPSVHFMEVEQVGQINGCDDAELAKLLLCSLDSRLYKALSVDSKWGCNTFAAVQEEILEAMGLWPVYVSACGGNLGQDNLGSGDRAHWLRILAANSLPRLRAKAEFWFNPKDPQVTEEMV